MEKTFTIDYAPNTIFITKDSGNRWILVFNVKGDNRFSWQRVSNFSDYNCCAKHKEQVQAILN